MYLFVYTIVYTSFNLALFKHVLNQPSMKNCIVCKMEINEGEVCQSCFQFLKWKHKKKYFEKIREFRKLENKDSGSIKFRRKK